MEVPLLGNTPGAYSPEWAHAAAAGMFVVQSLCNLFVPSGSGQAYVTMPLMAPIADIVGVSRQVAVLAYQMGDGFMNIIVPTNAVIVGSAIVGRIEALKDRPEAIPGEISVFLKGLREAMDGVKKI